LFRRKIAFLFGVLLLVIQVIPAKAANPVAPVASFTHSPQVPLINQVVIFDASASYDPNGHIDSYTWNFSDGSEIIIIPDAVTYHTYTAVGNYNVTLTVTDNETLTDTTWTVVTVRDYPVASFTYTPSYPIVGEMVTFNASDSTPDGGTIVNYTWNFRDGNITTVANPVITHAYNATGSYNVTLTITDSENLADTTWAVVPVRNYPNADFTWSPERPLLNEMVTFNASLSTPNGGTIMNYTWDFGDENITTVDYPVITHVYIAFRTYNVTLTVTDSEYLAGTCSKSVLVRKLPRAIFTYSPLAPLVGETVTFNASLSTPNGGTIINYSWKFGDGANGTGEIATHAYMEFGIYTVNLTITDSEDLTDTCSDTIRILVAPTASFTYSPTKPIVNESVTFNASASYDPDRSIQFYTWNFRDGNITTVANPFITHAYNATGSYNVTLTVTDDDGLTDSAWRLITVYTFVDVHDVAVISVEPSVANPFVGRVINITVVARNEGTAVETFNVTVYYDHTKLQSQDINYMLPGTNTTLVFSWDTTGFSPAVYNVTAQASLVREETDILDNTFTNVTVQIRMFGDVDSDGWVSSYDLFELADAFGTTPGDPNWNPNCDFDHDDWMSSYDLFALADNFGKSA